jgi:hypothetical protein
MMSDMTSQDKIDDAERLISACGTADWIAGKAWWSKEAGEYLNDDTMLRHYEYLKNTVMYYAGIPDDYEPVMNAVLKDYYNE